MYQLRDCNELIDSFKRLNNLSSDNKVACAVGVSRSMISQIRAHKTQASTPMKLRLLFGIGAIQSHHDLIEALMESLPEKTAEAVRAILVQLEPPVAEVQKRPHAANDRESSLPVLVCADC